MLKDALGIFDFFQDKEDTEFGEDFQRMDKDYELWDMDPDSILNNYDANVRSQSKEHKSQVRIVSDDLRINSDNIDSILASAAMDIKVKMAEETGQDLRNEIGVLERLFHFALYMADERLKMLILPPLKETLIWHATKRGYAAARVLVYKGKDGGVVFNFVPYDPRWLVYEVGGEGLLRVAYKTFRSGVSLKSEYGYADGGKSDNPVVDYWEQIDENLFGNTVVTKDAILKPPGSYKIPSMPFSIVPVSTRPPISGVKMKGGDSIFAAVRNLNALRNRVMSIWASHGALKENQPILNYMDEQGIRIDDAMTDIPGGVWNLKKDHNRVEPSPLPDISPTTVNLAGWLDSQIAQALLSPVYRMEEPAASGTRAAIAEEAGNKVFNPQLRALGYVYEDICRLIEEQLIAGGINVKVQGIQGNKYFEVKVRPVDLKKPHMTKVSFTAKPSWLQLATAQMADMMLRQGYPKSWVNEHIYKFQDPKLMDDLEALEIYDNSPTGMMERAADALYRVRRDRKAAGSIVDEMVRMETEATGQAPAMMPVPPSPPTGGGI